MGRKVIKKTGHLVQQIVTRIQTLECTEGILVYIPESWTGKIISTPYLEYGVRSKLVIYQFKRNKVYLLFIFNGQDDDMIILSIIMRHTFYINRNQSKQDQ